MAQTQNKDKMLELTTEQIEKKFGKGAIMKLGSNAEHLEVAAIPTGALPLDAALGIGGVPRGRIVEIYGPESSGKTTLALQILAEAQALGGVVAFIDAEHALDPTYAARLGVDIDEVLISQPDTGEQALEICDMLVRSGAIDVVVIDSVSKRFSACGARIGCVITRNSDLYNNAMKWCQGRLCASTIDQVASAALYTVGPEYFDAVRKEYKARRDTLVEGLKKIPGVIYSEPKGAFYVMAKLPVDDAEKFQLFMLEEFDDNGDTLMFTPAESFYKTPHTGVNEIRMAYVINQDALKRSMELLAKGIEAYNRPLPIGSGRFLYWISFAFCRRLRLSSTTAESTHTQPRALSGVSFSWNTKMPTSVATTGSNDARMDALPVSSPVRP